MAPLPLSLVPAISHADVSKLVSTHRSSKGFGESLPFLYKNMAYAAVAAAKLYDAEGGLDGAQACFEQAFMNFKTPQPV